MVGPDAPCAAGGRIAIGTNSAASQPVSSRSRSCTSRRAAGPAEHPGRRMPSVETISGTSPAGVIPKTKMSSGSGRVARERVGGEASAAVLGFIVRPSGSSSSKPLASCGAAARRTSAGVAHGLHRRLSSRSFFPGGNDGTTCQERTVRIARHRIPRSRRGDRSHGAERKARSPGRSNRRRRSFPRTSSCGPPSARWPSRSPCSSRAARRPST